MNLEQIDDLLARIKIHRPFFMKDMKKEEQILLKKEWYKVLINYDNSEVNFELDEYLKDPSNDSKIPAVYNLISNLKKIANKNVDYEPRVYCKICNANIGLKNYQKHHDRCSSIEYLSKMSFKYLNMKLRKEELRRLSDEEFEKLYWECCNSLLKRIENPIELHFLKNSIAAHEGKELDLDLSMIINAYSTEKKI